MNLATKTLPEIKKRVISGISTTGNEYAVYSTSIRFYAPDFNFNIINVANPFKFETKNTLFCAAINLGENLHGDCKIAHGDLISLPHRTLPAIYTADNNLGVIKQLKAQGEVVVGGKRISWVGSGHNSRENCAVIYNSRKITRSFDVINHRSSVVNFNANEVGIGLYNYGNELVVNEISNIGTISLINNSLVLVGEGELFKGIGCGQKVERWRVDGLASDNPISLSSANCLIQRSLSDTIMQLRKCTILPQENFSKAECVQSARSVVIKTLDNEIVFLSIAANPNFKLQHGLTMIDLQRYIYLHYQVDWAMCCSNETCLEINSNNFTNKSLVKPGPERALYCKQASSYLCATLKQ